MPIFRYKRPCITAIILLLGVTSCANPILTNRDDPHSISPISSCTAPDQYALSALQWTDDKRGAELERLAQQLDSTKGYCSVLELAVFLSIPSINYQDDAKAIMLIEKLIIDERVSKTERNYIEQLLPHITQRHHLRQLVNLLQHENESLHHKSP